MNITVEAQAIAAGVLHDVREMGEETGGELRDRAVKATEMATQLYLNQLAGIDTTADQEILNARFQALRAAGSSALAGAIVAGLRATFLKGLTVLATL